MLLLPFVGLLPDVLDRRGDDVTPTRYAVAQMIAVVDLSVRMQVVLWPHLLVALELIQRNRFTGLAIEATARSFLRILIVSGHGPRC
jgi:hypothetical protein